MERINHFVHLFWHCYYLDLEDYYTVSYAMTQFVNSMIPSFIGPWIFGQIYLINNSQISTINRRLIKISPFVCPFLSIELVYLVLFRNNPEFEALFTKYPKSENLKLRNKLNPRNMKQPN